MMHDVRNQTLSPLQNHIYTLKAIQDVNNNNYSKPKLNHNMYTAFLLLNIKRTTLLLCQLQNKPHIIINNIVFEEQYFTCTQCIHVFDRQLGC